MVAATSTPSRSRRTLTLRIDFSPGSSIPLALMSIHTVPEILPLGGRTGVGVTVVPRVTVVPGVTVGGIEVLGTRLVAVGGGTVVGTTVVSGPVIAGTVVGNVVAGTVVGGTVVGGAVVGGAVVGGTVVGGTVVVVVTGAMRTTGVLTVEVGEMTVAEFGASAEARAVLTIEPASTSAAVTTYVAVQVAVAAGASGPAGHDTIDRPTNASLMLIERKVTLPLFVTAKRYVNVSPMLTVEEPSASLLEASDLTSETRGPCGVTVVTVEGVDDTDVPLDVVP